MAKTVNECLWGQFCFTVSLSLTFLCCLIEYRRCRWPFQRFFKRRLLSLWLSEPAGKWDELILSFSTSGRPWETSCTVVGLDTISCLKLCFLLILVSAASTASKSACFFVTYAEKKQEGSKPENVEVVLSQTVNVVKHRRSLMSHPHCTRRATAFKMSDFMCPLFIF